MSEQEKVSFPYVFGESASWKYPGLSVSVETITPEVAAEMLKANVANRARKREPIKRAILDGEWRLNGASIVFDKDGILRDGQNRLYACVESGRPIDTVVVRGVESRSQVTMDVGVKRQVADFLKLDGYKEAVFLGSMGSAMERADRLGIETGFRRKSNSIEASVASIVRFTEDAYEDRILPIMRHVRRMRVSFRGVSAGTLAVLFDAFRAAGDDELDAFVNQVTGISEPCQPVRLLIKKLNENSFRRNERLPQIVVAVYIIKTWNAYMAGSEMQLLRYTQGGSRPEAFPEIFTGYES